MSLNVAGDSRRALLTAFLSIVCLTLSGCARVERSSRAVPAPVLAAVPALAAGDRAQRVALVGARPSVPDPSNGFNLFGEWNALRGDAYALDDIERQIETPGRKLVCDRAGLVAYTGTTLRYRGAVEVKEAFAERLARFEQVVAESATDIYGRAPRTVLHLGAFSCRASRGRSYRLSEHALGNALDVSGFDFGPLPADATTSSDLPKSLRRGFQITVARHWKEQSSDAARLHARFLHELVDRLVARGDVFRGFVGPPYPGHHDHLHLDMAPWRYVRGMNAEGDERS